MNSITCHHCAGRGYTAAIPCETGESCEVCHGAGFHSVTCVACEGRNCFPAKFRLQAQGLVADEFIIDLDQSLPLKIQEYKVSDGNVSRTWQLDLTGLMQQVIGEQHPLDTILFIREHLARDPRTWLKPITLMGNLAGRGDDPTMRVIQQEAAYIAARHFYDWLNGEVGKVEIRPRPSLNRLFLYLEGSTDGAGFEIIAKQSPRGRFWTVWNGQDKLAVADDYIEALYNACIALENREKA